MKVVKDDRSINLKELLFYVISRWRSFIVVALLTVLITIIINCPNVLFYAKQEGVEFVCTLMIKSILTYVLASILFVFVVYASRYIFSDTIKSVNEYLSTCELRLIGVIPKEKEKRLSCIDKFVRNCSGIRTSGKNRDKLQKRISNVIVCEIETGKNINKPNITIVSSYSDETAEQLYNLLFEDFPAEYATLVIAGDIFESAYAVEAVMKADYIVLAESQDNTRYFELVRLCKELESWKKNILGTVLMDVDTV